MITVIGSLNYDLVTFTDKVPAGGETYKANSFENHLGGKGLNESLACARLSPAKPHIRMVGNVGADTFGNELKKALVDADVDTQFLKTIENQSSGVAVILVEKSGENRILISAGANGDLKPTEENYKSYFSDSQDGDFVVLQNEYPHTLQSIDWIKSNKPTINISYNPSPFHKEYITEENLGKIDLLIVNEGEALEVASCVFKEELSEFEATIKDDAVRGFSVLAEKLQLHLDQNNVSAAIITMGSQGSVYASKQHKATFQKSQKVDKVIDTTGAGDTFFGAVVLQLSHGSTLAGAVEFATRASALAIQKKGAAEGIPTFLQVEQAK